MLQVRDRATIHLAELTDPQMPNLLNSPWDIPPASLQQALQKYMDEGDFSEPFKLVGKSPLAPCSKPFMHLSRLTYGCSTVSGYQICDSKE